MNMSDISRENCKFGNESQKWVAEWLTKKTGVTAVSKPRKGIDVICGEMNVEVKSISSLLKEWESKDESRSQMALRGFKLEHLYIKDITTHYAFVFYDEIFIAIPVILIVDVEILNKFIRQKGESEWTYVPIWWVKRNFNRDLSKFGEVISK